MRSAPVVIAGISGFIGTALTRRLIQDGRQVVGLTRNPSRVSKTWPSPPPLLTAWDGRSAGKWEEVLNGASAVVNLTGDNLAAGRWTAAKKERILSSRIQTTHALAEAIQRASIRPGVLIQASAVGFYGRGNNQIFDESSGPGRGFLADVVRGWEGAADGITGLGVRTVVLRLGLVLGRQGGVLPRLLLPFRLGFGGRIGSGRQWMSWIHIGDLLKVVTFCMDRPELAGPVNAVSPDPVPNREFAAILAKVLHRPAWFPVPAPVLKLVWGQMARETILSGQRAIPKQLLGAGFNFEFPDLLSALNDLLITG